MSKDGTALKVKNVEDRGPDGKFLPGNKLSPGVAVHNKNRRMYQETLNECVSKDDFAEVTKVLLGKAKEGEGWAIKELLDRLLGKAKQVAEVDVKASGVDPATVVNQIAIILGIDDE